MNRGALVMRMGLPEPTASIDLRYFEPAPDLRALVSSYYFFHANMARVADVMRADLGQLRFMLSGFGHYVLGGGVQVETPAICLLGPSTMATRFDVTGPVAVFGMGLHPAGWAALVREDAGLHADCATDAVDRFGVMLEDALDAMRMARDMSALIAIADTLLRAIARHGAPPPLDLTRVTDAWLTGATDPSVDALVAGLGVSGRQAERLVKRIYGAPPKLLARKYRTLRAASIIGTSGSHWSDVAGDAFFDQSHFIRDFKRFTGVTPTEFQNRPSPVTRLTLQRRAVLGTIAPLARVS